MGIRIHKFMGYGLCDVAGEREDPRINWESFLIRGEGERNDAGVYNAWLADREENFLDRWFLRDNPPGTKGQPWLTDCIAYSPEFGMPNVLVLRPLSCRDWDRYDNAIDYVVATELEDPRQANRLDALRHNLYPFTHYMDSADGRKLSDRVYSWLRATSPDAIEPWARDAIAENLGFKDAEEADARIAPMVPPEVRDLVEYAELFTAADTWLQLRPMLYTYWS